MLQRIARWAKASTPTREQLARGRWTGPLAARAELWRFTRRSVPRGVAVGLLVGIFALIPGVQIAGAALLCLPLRGNIPVAAGMTFLSNPATTPFLIAASLWVGSALGFHADIATFRALLAEGADIGAWTAWLLSDAAPALVVGLAVIAAVAATLGYVIAIVGWRLWTARKRRARLRRAALRSGPA